MASGERANPEAAVAQDDALFGALFGHTAMCVAVFSIGGRFLHCSDSFNKAGEHGRQQVG